MALTAIVFLAGLTFAVNPPAINNVNIPPTGLEIDEGTDYNVTGQISEDVGVAHVNFSLDDGTPWDVNLETDDSFWWVLTGLTVGSHSLNISVMDDEGLSSFRLFTITVLGDPPAINNVNIPPWGLEIDEGTEYNLTGVIAEDVGVAWVNISIGGGTPFDANLEDDDTFWYVLMDLAVGNQSLNISVMDDEGLSSFRLFTINVTKTGGNPPGIDMVNISPDGLEIEEGTEFNLTGKITTEVGVAWVKVALNDGTPMDANLEEDDTFWYLFTDLAVDEYSLNITTMDTDELTSFRLFSIVVTAVSTSDPPTIDNLNMPPSGHEVEEGMKLNLTGKVTEDVGVAWAKVSLDNGTAMDVNLAEDDTFWYEFTGLSLGAHEINISAEDTDGQATYRLVHFTVIEHVAGDVPTIDNVNILSGHTIEKGTDLVLTGKITEDDGIEWVRVSLDDGTPMDVTLEEDATWSHTFTGLSVGEHKINITVMDIDDQESYKEVTFTVKEKDDDDDDEDETNWLLYIGIVIIILVVLMVLMMLMRGGGDKPAPAAPAPEAEPEPEPKEEE